MDIKKKPPIFEIGVARSGTTILSLMLDSHPRIAIPYESHFFTEYYRHRESINDELNQPELRQNVVERILNEKYVKGWDYTPSIEAIDLSNCSNLAETIRELYVAYARHHGKDIWGDKTPSYITNIDVLNNLFPDAKYIHLVRDGRDVALSLMQQWFGPNDFITALNFWKERIMVGQKMLAMLPPDRVFLLKMEDLAEAPEERLHDLCEFLEVDYAPEMLTAFSRKAANKVGNRIDSHHAGLSGPIDIGNVTKWKKVLSGPDQAIAWEYAGSILNELGYPPGTKRHWAKNIFKVKHRLTEAVKARPRRLSRST
ncbi:sulfotransferase [Marinobacter sp. HL-58]|uniref:sulfotransferase family protein n=1 Tax=Marinobacter sp. HL-58 TaxID=1479237 RepID=UPI00068C695B|nr:sulfotransferase [Marinobacter sp. HL-58]KPQ01374.1 MAG: sulfotransferase [Marinobacter sp. HL-58]